MKAKVIKNYNLRKKVEVFGIAFQVKAGAQYCKYPLGMQDYKTKNEAENKLQEVQEKLDSLSSHQIEFINAQPINKHQYVKL